MGLEHEGHTAVVRIVLRKQGTMVFSKCRKSGSYPHRRDSCWWVDFLNIVHVRSNQVLSSCSKAAQWKILPSRSSAGSSNTLLVHLKNCGTLLFQCTHTNYFCFSYIFYSYMYHTSMHIHNSGYCSRHSQTYNQYQLIFQVDLLTSRLEMILLTRGKGHFYCSFCRISNLQCFVVARSHGLFFD